MEDNDAHATTIGQYLALLTKGVWDYEESFDGKRPFGNSGWQSDIHYALIKAGAVEGTIKEDLWIVGHDLDEINSLMRKVTGFLVTADWTTLQLPPQPKEWIVVALDVETQQVADNLPGILDEATAKATAEAKNNTATFWKWVALRVPK